MDKNLQNIEDLFRKGLADNEEMPSPDVWNGIDKMLDKDNVVSINKKYNSLKIVALLLLFLLFGLSIYELSNRHNKNNVATQNKESVTNDNSNEVFTNTIPSKRLADSVRINKNEHQNTIPENSVADKNLPDSHPLVQPGNNATLKKKKDIVSDNTIPSLKPTNSIKLNKNDNQNVASDKATKVKPGNNYSKAIYKVKIKSAKPVEDKEQVVINNDDKETGNQLPFLRQLNPVTIENVNISANDSVDTKKLLQPLAFNKIIPQVNTKNALASNTKKKVGKPSRFSITPFFSPDVTWYHLQNDKNNNQTDDATEIENSETHEFSSTVGALVGYKLNSYWSLQSGLTYSNTNISVMPKTLYAQTDNTGNVKYRINTSSGYGYILPSFSSNPAIGDSLYAFTSTHTLQYTGIPVAVKYNIVKGKFSFNALAGVSTNFLVNGKIETTLEKGGNNEIDIVNNIQCLKKIYFSGLTGFGVECKFSKMLALSFAPTFRFALNSINQGAPVKSYPNSFGLAVGLKIGL